MEGIPARYGKSFFLLSRRGGRVRKRSSFLSFFLSCIFSFLGILLLFLLRWEELQGSPLSLSFFCAPWHFGDCYEATVKVAEAAVLLTDKEDFLSPSLFRLLPVGIL